jgi:hypothetical protein
MIDKAVLAALVLCGQFDRYVADNVRFEDSRLKEDIILLKNYKDTILMSTTKLALGSGRGIFLIFFRKQSIYRCF